MKFIQWLVQLKEDKQLLACCFIVILFLSGGWLKEKKEFADYRTSTETKRIDSEIAHSEKDEKKYEWIIKSEMENNLQIMKLMDRIDSLNHIISSFNHVHHEK